MDGFHCNIAHGFTERETMLWHASCVLMSLQDAVVFKAMEVYRDTLKGWPMPENGSADDDEVLFNTAEG